MMIKHETNEKSGPDGYIEKAIMNFSEIMSSNRVNIMEAFNRANKGELFVLHFLSLRGNETFPSELSAALRSSTSRISSLLGALEKKGQIKRDVDKSNRRNVLVTITEAGRKRVDTELTKMKESITRIFAEMGEAETVEFTALFKKFFFISQKHMADCEGCAEDSDSD